VGGCFGLFGVFLCGFNLCLFDCWLLLYAFLQTLRAPTAFDGFCSQLIIPSHYSGAQHVSPQPDAPVGEQPRALRGGGGGQLGIHLRRVRLARAAEQKELLRHG
jgi:hypothetical protein